MEIGSIVKFTPALIERQRPALAPFNDGVEPLRVRRMTVRAFSAGGRSVKVTYQSQGYTQIRWIPRRELMLAE